MKYQKVSASQLALFSNEKTSLSDQIQTNFVVVLIDKGHKAASIYLHLQYCFYVEVISKEIGILGFGNESYVRIDQETDEIVNENVFFLCI